jgi:hypothetical protein
MASGDSIRRIARSITAGEARPVTRGYLAIGAIISSEAVTTITERPLDGLGCVVDCLLNKDALGDFLRKAEINPDSVRRCVKILCDQRHLGNP